MFYDALAFHPLLKPNTPGIPKMAQMLSSSVYPMARFLYPFHQRKQDLEGHGGH